MIDRFAATWITRSPRQSYLPPGVQGRRDTSREELFSINTAVAGPLPSTPPALCQNSTDRSVGVSVHVVADNKHVFESNICENKLFQNKCTDGVFACVWRYTSYAGRRASTTSHRGASLKSRKFIFHRAFVYSWWLIQYNTPDNRIKRYQTLFIIIIKLQFPFAY